MKRLPVLLTMLIVISIPSAAPAQADHKSESVFHDYLNASNSGGFLRIPGLDFRSSMGVSYYSSNNYGSTGIGYYMGHFRMELTSSLILRCDVGVRSMLTNSNMNTNPQFFVPNLDLTYQPSKNFKLRFQYRQFSYPRHMYFR